MMNYIWLALVILGIVASIANDWIDISSNKYHNGEEYAIEIFFSKGIQFPLEDSKTYPCSIRVKSLFDVYQKAKYTPSGSESGFLKIEVDDNTPPLWKSISEAQPDQGYINSHAIISRGGAEAVNALIKFEPVKFVKLKAVTNDGIIKYAKIAVELAIGLIGIMALWLGVMKIAEQSGLIAKISNFIKPVMSKLFPDVPPDHPAMGAMIMNISANILGLANAATPLGLKAMEELNKLNKKVGTATDAMCTFLVINTSNVQLIPATVIAIRAAAGSMNPTEIIGPIIVATTISTVVGVITVKVLEKLKRFRKSEE